VNEDLFPELDQVLKARGAAAGLDFLIERFRAAGEYGLMFEARLMKKRVELGLPPVQTDSISTPEYQNAVVESARETGRLFLEAGNIERAWPYFRAISEPGPVAVAIERVEPREGLEGVIGIAFQEGVHPLKGLELIVQQHGMCRAITAFGMQAVAKDREKCIALLATNLHEEIRRRMAGAIAEQEGTEPAGRSLLALMDGREWLFGEWSTYVDTSHLLSVIPYCAEVTERETLHTMHELCEYGKRLSPRFQSPGNPPFTDQYAAYDHYIQALLRNNVEEHLDYFRTQARECDLDTVGDAPGRTLVKLLATLGRHEEALETTLNYVIEDAPYGMPVPSALQLCRDGGNFARMKELARERGDLLSYTAGAILTQ
jgi:hypothetical protein